MQSLKAVKRKSLIKELKELLNSTALKRAGMNGVSVKAYPQSILISMTEKRKQALGNGLCVGAGFIDFRKAFDTVSHPILSRKLQAIGIW